MFSLLSSASGVLPQDFRNTDLFRVCVQAGIVPGAASSGAVVSDGAENDIAPIPFDLRIEGMWCPSCAWVIEEVLRRLRGVNDVSVAFVADTVKGSYFPHLVSLEDIAGVLTKLGYRPITEKADGTKSKKESIIRLCLSAILTAEVMMFSMGLDGGFFARLSFTEIRYLSIPLLLLAAPVVFWGGYPILKMGLSALLHRSPSMDTLVSVAALSAFGYSLVTLAHGSLHLYFDTAAMLITFVLVGRYMETWLREKVLFDVASLHSLSRQKVRLIGEDERWVRADEAPLDALLEVRTGERVPVDGTVMDGQAVVDESILTGEARPVNKRLGDEVLSGSTIDSGRLVLAKKRSGSDSFAGQILALMENAIMRKNRQELLADSLSRLFVPAIVLIATGTSTIMWFLGSSSEDILLRGLTVLLVACPCSLGIAIPLIKVAIVGIARRQGIIIRDANAMERIRNLDVMVFDKTGTLTEGSFRLLSIRTMGHADQDEILSCLAAIERHSSHMIAREIVRAAEDRNMPARNARGYKSFDGLGVSGATGDLEIFIGNRRFMEEMGLKGTPEQEVEARQEERQGRTVVFYGWLGAIGGFLVFGDKVKENAANTVQGLKNRGVAIWMISGDTNATTQAVADQLGLGQCVGQVIPPEKASFIRRLQEDGHRVGMVGDGINDAPAIAQADVGFALASTSDIVHLASDLALLTTDPAVLNMAFDLSRRSSRALAQNLFFAFIYNACVIPLAIIGIFNPPHCGLRHVCQQPYGYWKCLTAIRHEK